MKSTAVQIPSAQRCFLYFYSARSIGRYAESPCGNSSPISAKPFFSQNALLCGLPLSTARRTFAEPLSPQFVHQLADECRTEAVALPLLFRHKEADVGGVILRVALDQVQHGDERFSVEKNRDNACPPRISPAAAPSCPPKRSPSSQAADGSGRTARSPRRALKSCLHPPPSAGGRRIFVKNPASFLRLAGREHFPVVLVVCLQKLGRVQAVGALRHAVAAVAAVFDLVHLLLPFLGEPRAAAGARRSMSDMRAHWLISMPAGHGMQ